MTEFYKPKPIAPEKSNVARALRWSLWISVTGWATYGLFAFSFADLSVIPGWLQSALVLLGSALIVIGAETNTIPTGISALSKLGTSRFSIWDASAFIASLVGTLCAVLITFSTRQDELAATWWREFSISWGPLVLGCATVLDLYGALAELSFAKRDYEIDMEQWIEEKRTWDAAEAKGEHEVPQWTTAKIEDFRVVLGRLNGSRATLTAEKLEEELAADFKQLPSESTTKRWLKLAKKGDMS